MRTVITISLVAAAVLLDKEAPLVNANPDTSSGGTLVLVTETESTSRLANPEDTLHFPRLFIRELGSIGDKPPAVQKETIIQHELRRAGVSYIEGRI
jgi:hypothetical protein